MYWQPYTIRKRPTESFSEQSVSHLDQMVKLCVANGSELVPPDTSCTAPGKPGFDRQADALGFPAKAEPSLLVRVPALIPSRGPVFYCKALSTTCRCRTAL